MYLFLLRHGESVANAEGGLSGGFDPVLTERGRRQARWAGHYLSKTHLDVFYCGPLLRNLETAQRISEECGLQPKLLWWTFEAGANIIARTWNSIASEFPLMSLEEDCPEWQRDTHETREEAFERAGALVRLMRERYEDTDLRIGVVSHGTFIEMFIANCLGLELDDRTHLGMGNCAFHWLELKPAWTMVRKLNNECHIPEDERT